MDKFIIFGCGFQGKKIAEEIGIDNVKAFIDNDPKKIGGEWNKISILNLRQYREMKYMETILIPATEYFVEIRNQLLDENIDNYKIYEITSKIGDEDSLVVNPYLENEHLSYDGNKSIKNRILIRDYATQLFNENNIFQGIEIETYNRCNGGCEFCPVSKKNDTRIEMKMEDQLFEKIINNLAEINYAGKVSLFSNNEPFLDERIVEFQKYVRKKLPQAYLYLYTNGTLLTLEKFIDIIDSLDELIIDNYNQSLDLIPPVKRIAEYCEQIEELKRKVTIFLRKPQEVLTTRGGDSPNAIIQDERYQLDSCTLPFKQFIVRPDGKISLCCNDPLGKYTLGDLNLQTIEEVWYGERYMNIRKKIISGRKNISKCEKCDTFYI